MTDCVSIIKQKTELCASTSRTKTTRSFDLPASHLAETCPPCFPQVLVVDEPLPRFKRRFLVMISNVGKRKLIGLAGWALESVGRVNCHLHRRKTTHHAQTG